MDDGRHRPRIPTGRIVRSILLMLWVRMGSLHGLDQCRPGGGWRRWLGGALPSDDRIGDVAALMDLSGLRDLLGHIYGKYRRNKNLLPWAHGLRVAIFDGHETPGSYLRCCPECLTRTVETRRGKRIHYYHRHVAALLLHERGALLLDMERQRPGEGEMAAAVRLLERLLSDYPGAFKLVAGDALYLNPTFCELALQHKKDFIGVLKNENRDLLTDARSLFPEATPIGFHQGKTTYACWDIEGFRSWWQLDYPVRVVRSVETRTVRRQRTKREETEPTEWIWATSLSSERVSTRAVVRLGHGRWAIENQGFNVLVNQWHADHMYKHDPNAIIVFHLLLFAAYNLFHAFVRLNLKPPIRQGRTHRFWAGLIASEFYQRLRPAPSAHPP